MHDPKYRCIRHRRQIIAAVARNPVDKLLTPAGSRVAPWRRRCSRGGLGGDRSRGGSDRAPDRPGRDRLARRPGPVVGARRDRGAGRRLLALFSPLAVAAAVFPAVIATRRLGGGGIDLSYADAVLVVSTVLALPFVPWKSRTLRNVLGALGIYLVVLAITIMVNPSVRAVVELSTDSSWSADRSSSALRSPAAGKTRLALRLFIAACTAVAVAAIVYTLSRGSPAYPFGIHKNAAGFFLTCGLLLSLVTPRHLCLPKGGVVTGAGAAGCRPYRLSESALRRQLRRHPLPSPASEVAGLERSCRSSAHRGRRHDLDDLPEPHRRFRCRQVQQPEHPTSGVRPHDGAVAGQPDLRRRRSVLPRLCTDGVRATQPDRLVPRRVGNRRHGWLHGVRTSR